MTIPPVPELFEGPSDAGILRDYLNDLVIFIRALAGASQTGPYLAIVNNLSDVNSVPAARNNLGLGSAALQPASAFDPSGSAAAAQAASDPVGSAAAAQAASDPVGSAAAVAASSLQKSANLSDIANAATARGNISAAASGANSDITALNALGVKSVTSNYVILAGDAIVQVDATSGPVIVTFSAGTAAGKMVQVIKIDPTDNGVTINDGTNDVAYLIGQYQRLCPYSTGASILTPQTLT